MSGFNEKERQIAKFFSKFPFFKSIIKKTYQRINYIFFRKPYNYKSSHLLYKVPTEGETFFGYYDKSPVSADNRFLLFHLSDYSTKNIPSSEKAVKVCLMDLANNKIVYSNFSKSYNWQQGTKLQWLTTNQFIYNNYSNEIGYHSLKIAILDDCFRETIIPYPVYDTFKDQYALTLNFERLLKLRPDYGYRNHDTSKPLIDYNEDGVYHIDLSDGRKKLLFTINQIMNIEQNNMMKAANHKINHIMIAPNGENFIFIHRYFVNDRRFDRLMVSNLDGSNIRLLASDEMVSHCNWLNDDEIIAYLRDFERGDKYYKVNIKTLTKEIIGEGIIDKFGDGHPTVNNNKIVFDTYPNKARMKNLFLYNIDNKELIRLGEFFESMKFYGETRCDLHPRLSGDGESVYFDSVHEGSRGLYWIKIK